MDNLENHEPDPGFLKQNIEGHEESYPSDAWKNLEKKLKARRKRRFLLWWITGIAFLGLGSGFWFSPFSSAPQTGQLVMQSGKETKPALPSLENEVKSESMPDKETVQENKSTLSGKEIAPKEGTPGQKTEPTEAEKTISETSGKIENEQNLNQKSDPEENRSSEKKRTIAGLTKRKKAGVISSKPEIEKKPTQTENTTSSAQREDNNLSEIHAEKSNRSFQKGKLGKKKLQMVARNSIKTDKKGIRKNEGGSDPEKIASAASGIEKDIPSKNKNYGQEMNLLDQKETREQSQIADIEKIQEETTPADTKPEISETISLKSTAEKGKQNVPIKIESVAKLQPKEDSLILPIQKDSIQKNKSQKNRWLVSANFGTMTQQTTLQANGTRQYSVPNKEAYYEVLPVNIKPNLLFTLEGSRLWSLYSSLQIGPKIRFGLLQQSLKATLNPGRYSSSRFEQVDSLTFRGISKVEVGEVTYSRQTLWADLGIQGQWKPTWLPIGLGINWVPFRFQYMFANAPVGNGSRTSTWIKPPDWFLFLPISDNMRIQVDGYSMQFGDAVLPVPVGNRGTAYCFTMGLAWKW